MRYFLNAAERKKQGGTLYFEFQQGPYRGTHWLEHSVYLYADVFDELRLFPLFAGSIPCFNYYGPTEVTPAQYAHLMALALARGGETAALFEALGPWVQDCFRTEAVFTICGI